MSKLDIKTEELVKTPDSLSSMLTGAQVQPDSDLPPHGVNETTNSDSYYIVSYLDLVSSDGKYKSKCTTLFHLILVNSVPEKPTALLTISCLSDAGGKLDYFSNEVPNLAVPNLTLINKSNIKSKTLDIEVQPTLANQRNAASGRLWGTISHLSLQGAATTNGNSVQMELELDPYGPTLPDVVSGVIPFPHGVSYEFAFPNVKTSGILTLNKNSHFTASGTSWLDREWGLIGPIKWTWMGIRLKSEVEISLWSQQSCDQNGRPTPGAGSRSFATILNSDSNITVSTVELKEGALFRRSNGQDYPREWEVTIPGKCQGLKVTVSSDDQAIASRMIPRLEAKAHAIGTYEGKQVECDHVFVEAGVILLSSASAQQPANGGQANVAQNASPGSGSPAAVGGLVRETRIS